MNLFMVRWYVSRIAFEVEPACSVHSVLNYSNTWIPPVCELPFT